MATTKTTTKTPKAAASKAVRKPKAAAPKKEVTEAKPVAAVEHKAAQKPSGKYIFATGRRKTAIANVRLFEGKGENIVNKHPVKQHFGYAFHLDEISKPFEVTGLGDKHYYTAHTNGGGLHAQATALRHGISIALGKTSDDVRKILKKNGFLTRDDRKKERKKPGLKRARRSPQWAKR